MREAEIQKVASFVWEQLLSLDDEETAGSDHLDRAEFVEWLRRQV